MVSTKNGNRRRWAECGEFPRHAHRCGCCSLGSLLVYLYKGLVEDGRDKQRLLMWRLVTVDPGEVCMGWAEREGHAECAELIAHVGSPGDLEPREEEFHLADTHLRHAV